MARDFLNEGEKYCIWLDHYNPAELQECSLILERIENVKNMRNKSKIGSNYLNEENYLEEIINYMFRKDIGFKNDLINRAKELIEKDINVKEDYIVIIV